MAAMTHAKFHFNRLMLTLSFGIWASEPPSPFGPGEGLKRPGLVGLNIGNIEFFLTKFEALYPRKTHNMKEA